MASKGRAKNQNTDKSHCIRGHILDAKNTYVSVSGTRACRSCKNERERLKRRVAAQLRTESTLTP